MHQNNETIYETEGDTFSKTIKFTDNDDNDVDITGWTIYVTVKQNLDDDDADAILSDDVTSHDNASAGETSFSFAPSETEGLERTYFFEIKYKDDTGDVNTLYRTNLRFDRAVREST